jgi:hypothetical protein
VAHRLSVEAAVGYLPDPLRAFFSGREAALSDLSLEPDTRLKASDPDEARRHFFEMDALLRPDPTRVAGVPHDLDAARRKFGDAALRRAGILPWWIAAVAADLSRAMRAGDAAEIVKRAAYLSHYVADLHQPLHLTRNFDGQKTGEDGIHMAFERFMIERRRESFRPPPGPVELLRRIEDPAGWALGRAASVFGSVEPLLEADREAVAAAKAKGTDYYRELDARAAPLARRLLEQSARATAALWISAWIDAGRPDPSGWREPGKLLRSAPKGGSGRR